MLPRYQTDLVSRIAYSLTLHRVVPFFRKFNLLRGHVKGYNVRHNIRREFAIVFAKSKPPYAAPGSWRWSARRPTGKKAGIAVAVTKELVDRGVSAADLAAKAAKALGGGTAKNADVVSGGGPNVGEVDEALSLVRRQATEAVASGFASTAERERMGRVLGVDLGSRRIGLALSDPAGRVAPPHGMIERSGDPVADRRKILAQGAELTPPASWSGSRCRSPATPALPRGRSSRRSTPSARWRAKKSRWRPTMKGSRR